MPDYRVPRVQIVPQPGQFLSFTVDGTERLGWHFGTDYPRPFFYPVIGSSGRSLTRMGHPSAANHDHHKSFWWGHRSIRGVNFWEERGDRQQIRQEEWLHYQDGDEFGGMAVRLGWFDAQNTKVMDQQLLAMLFPLANDELWLELQTEFTSRIPNLEIGQTNFGFLGLRVAASISKHYGGGRITSSLRRVGERANFAAQAPWMDYSGPITNESEEGITWFDHPTNPHYPTSWHVRDDGWMSAAFSLRQAYRLNRVRPLRLRYGFHIHRHAVDHDIAERQRQRFADSRAWELARAMSPWRYNIGRIAK